MSNYQLYLEKARYQSSNNEQLLNEALETFFESDPYGNKEADAVAFLGLVTTAATLMGVALTPFLFAGYLFVEKMKSEFTKENVINFLKQKHTVTKEIKKSITEKSTEFNNMLKKLKNAKKIDDKQLKIIQDDLDDLTKIQNTSQFPVNQMQ